MMHKSLDIRIGRKKAVSLDALGDGVCVPDETTPHPADRICATEYPVAKSQDPGETMRDVIRSLVYELSPSNVVDAIIINRIIHGLTYANIAKSFRWSTSLVKSRALKLRERSPILARFFDLDPASKSAAKNKSRSTNRKRNPSPVKVL